MVPVAGIEPARGISPTDFEGESPTGSLRTYVELSGISRLTKYTKFIGLFQKKSFSLE